MVYPTGNNNDRYIANEEAKELAEKLEAMEDVTVKKKIRRRYFENNSEEQREVTNRKMLRCGKKAKSKLRLSIQAAIRTKRRSARTGRLRSAMKSRRVSLRSIESQTKINRRQALY